ncbi:hypothetical protein ACHAQA_006576 [Verticillium albo-atrum]
MGVSHSGRLLLPLALLFALLAPKAASQQCYFARGMLAPPEVVPCFPTNLDAGEASACCQAGDFCLTDGACFDPRSRTTYMYGCTDDTYEHANCPAKCGLDTDKSPWVGMIKCHDEDVDEDERDDPPYTWACNHPDTCGEDHCPNLATWSSTVFAQPSAPNGCDDLASTAEALVVMSWVLSGLHSLPTEVPSETTTTTETSSSSSSSEETSTGFDAADTRTVAEGSASPAETSRSPSESNAAEEDGGSGSGGGGLSTGASIGIGVGAGLAVLILAAVVWILLRRRNRKHHDAVTATTPSGPTMEKDFGPGGGPDRGPVELSPVTWSAYDGHDRPVSELASTISPSPPSQHGRFGTSPRPDQGRMATHQEIVEGGGQVHELSGGYVPYRA